VPLGALTAEVAVPRTVQLEPARAAGGKQLPSVKLELILSAAQPSSLRRSSVESSTPPAG
jgi:hypothetical protein